LYRSSHNDFNQRTGGLHRRHPVFSIFSHASMALCLVITGPIVIQPRLLFLLDIERRNGQAKALNGLCLPSKMSAPIG
jgi:hypothetical protein